MRHASDMSETVETAPMTLSWAQWEAIEAASAETGWGRRRWRRAKQGWKELLLPQLVQRNPFCELDARRAYLIFRAPGVVKWGRGSFASVSLLPCVRPTEAGGPCDVSYDVSLKDRPEEGSEVLFRVRKSGGEPEESHASVGIPVQHKPKGPKKASRIRTGRSGQTSKDLANGEVTKVAAASGDRESSEVPTTLPQVQRLLQVKLSELQTKGIPFNRIHLPDGTVFVRQTSWGDEQWGACWMLRGRVEESGKSNVAWVCLLCLRDKGTVARKGAGLNISVHNSYTWKHLSRVHAAETGAKKASGSQADISAQSPGIQMDGDDAIAVEDSREKARVPASHLEVQLLLQAKLTELETKGIPFDRVPLSRGAVFHRDASWGDRKWGACWLLKGRVEQDSRGQRVAWACLLCLRDHGTVARKAGLYISVFNTAAWAHLGSAHAVETRGRIRFHNPAKLALSLLETKLEELRSKGIPFDEIPVADSSGVVFKRDAKWRSKDSGWLLKGKLDVSTGLPIPAWVCLACLRDTGRIASESGLFIGGSPIGAWKHLRSTHGEELRPNDQPGCARTPLEDAPGTPPEDAPGHGSASDTHLDSAQPTRAPVTFAADESTLEIESVLEESWTASSTAERLTPFKMAGTLDAAVGADTVKPWHLLEKEQADGVSVTLDSTCNKSIQASSQTCESQPNSVTEGDATDEAKVAADCGGRNYPQVPGSLKQVQLLLEAKLAELRASGIPFERIPLPKSPTLRRDSGWVEGGGAVFVRDAGWPRGKWGACWLMKGRVEQESGVRRVAWACLLCLRDRGTVATSAGLYISDYNTAAWSHLSKAHADETRGFIRTRSKNPIRLALSILEAKLEELRSKGIPYDDIPVADSSGVIFKRDAEWQSKDAGWLLKGALEGDIGLPIPAWVCLACLRDTRHIASGSGLFVGGSPNSAVKHLRSQHGDEIRATGETMSEKRPIQDDDDFNSASDNQAPEKFNRVDNEMEIEFAVQEPWTFGSTDSGGLAPFKMAETLDDQIEQSSIMDQASEVLEDERSNPNQQGQDDSLVELLSGEQSSPSLYPGSYFLPPKNESSDREPRKPKNRNQAAAFSSSGEEGTRLEPEGREVSCPQCLKPIGDEDLEKHLREELDYHPIRCGLCACEFLDWPTAEAHFQGRFARHPGVSPRLKERRDWVKERRLGELLDQADRWKREARGVP